jgi:hypothetical protein
MAYKPEVDAEKCVGSGGALTSRNWSSSFEDDGRSEGAKAVSALWEKIDREVLE